MPEKKGELILFEGVEACGKSTQRNWAHDYFAFIKGYDCIKTREPGTDEVSEGIRNLLLNPKYQGKVLPETELFLFEGSRAQFSNNILKPELEKGKIIFCDRFFYSTIAYQGFGRKLKDKKMIGLDTIDDLNHIASQGITPDLTIIYDLSFEEMSKRMKKQERKLDRIEREKMEFHERVKEGYLFVGNHYPNVYVLDWTKSLGELHEETIQIIEEELGI